MRFDTKALLKLMKQSWRGGGVKIQRTEHRGLWDSFFITGAGWALLIPKENCPGEIAGQIVTWLADMPKIGESKWVVKGCDPQDIPEDDRTIDISRYTTGNYETGMACLLLASGLTGGDFSKVCLIDTEHRRGELYANRTDLGVGEFWYIELKAPYSPEHYKECVDAAVKQVGPDGVVIVDSLSHAWSNAGGVLEIKADIAAKPGKNSYTAWDEAGRIQNDFINYLLSVNCHTICTLRVKQDYVLTENDRGKQVPVKVGLAPVQRDDVEYEFDIMFTIGRDHIATTSKDVTFLDGFGAVITSDLGKQLAEWANDGKEPTRCEECGRLVSATSKMTIDQLADYTRKTYGKCLCAACAVKLEKASRAAEKEKEAAHAPQ